VGVDVGAGADVGDGVDMGVGDGADVGVGADDGVGVDVGDDVDEVGGLGVTELRSRVAVGSLRENPERGLLAGLITGQYRRSVLYV